MKVYPNPFNGLLHLTATEGCTLQVINAASTVVHSQNIENPDETIRRECTSSVSRKTEKQRQ